MLHKEALVAKLLGTNLSIQVHKKVKFSRRDNSSLAVKGLIPCLQVKIVTEFDIITELNIFQYTKEYRYNEIAKLTFIKSNAKILLPLLDFQR